MAERCFPCVSGGWSYSDMLTSASMIRLTWDKSEHTDVTMVT